MGPNSLPVPEFFPAEFPRKTELEFGFQHHFSDGDKTYNFLTNAFFSVVPGRVGLRIHYIPIEFYKTDSVTRNLRGARDLDLRGYSFGDFYVSTFFQVIKDHEKLPDLMLSVNIKTASGTNLANARHTDSPGYYFSASLGKTYKTGKNIITAWRPYFTGGFYSYQTNSSTLLQNDAFLFGFGGVISTPKLKFDNKIAGYLGYFGDGDQPVVYRLRVYTIRESLLNYKFGLQLGIHDVPFTSFNFSVVLRFEKLQLFWGEASKTLE